MKKILSLLGLGLCLSANAQNYRSVDLLSGNQSFFLTNAATIKYNDSLVGITNAQGTAVYSLTNLYSTSGFNASNTNLTNANVFFGQAWVDVPVWSDRNGNDASLSISYSALGLTARSTNTVTLTFARVMKGTQSGLTGTNAYLNGTPIYFVDTNSADEFVFSYTNSTGTAPIPVNIMTNIPTAFMQGSWGIRLQSIASTDNGAAAAYAIQYLGVSGYQP